MSVSLNWNNSQNTLRREQRLASLFLGYRSVLEILADIHEGFRPILEAHTDVLCRHYAEHPFKPPIYKIIDTSGEVRKIAYLVGSIHHRLMTKEDFGLANMCPFFPGAMLTKTRIQATCIPENLKKVLLNSDVYAHESSSHDLQYVHAEAQEIVKRHGKGCSDRLHADKRIKSQNFVLAHGYGLDNSAARFIDGRGIEEQSLEPIRVHLAAIEEILQFPKVKDMEEVMQLFDLFTGRTDMDFVEEYFLRGLHRCDSYMNRHMKWRNPPIAKKILELMMKKRNVTAFVGVDHLFGEYGLLTLLEESDMLVLRVDPPIRDDRPITYSYDPNWGIKISYSDE